MRNLLIPFLAFCLLGCGPELDDTDEPVGTTSSIFIQNKAFATLNGFYISDGTGYGPNQIEGKLISTGQSYEISGIECGKTYTLKVVRINADDVIQKDVPIDCGNDYIWGVK